MVGVVEVCEERSHEESKGCSVVCVVDVAGVVLNQRVAVRGLPCCKCNDSSDFFNYLKNGITSSNISYVAYILRCFSALYWFICLSKNY